MKALVNPLLFVILLQIAGVAWLLCQRISRSRAIILWGLLILNLMLAGLATPIVSHYLEQGLTILPPKKLSLSPRFIFVLGGGYLIGATPKEDILVIESQRRVLLGVATWMKYPSAKLVFSGASHTKGSRRPPNRHALLMADLAYQYGVPRKVMILESNSTNTAAHPVEALKLPGITFSTPIAIVTNSWHMRRARREFLRYFKNVMPISVPSLSLPSGWICWLPCPDSLEKSTTLICEWVGMLWYSVNSYFIPVGQ